MAWSTCPCVWHAVQQWPPHPAPLHCMPNSPPSSWPPTLPTQQRIDSLARPASQVARAVPEPLQPLMLGLCCSLGKPAKRPRGWWRQPGNLETELQKYIQPQSAKPSQADPAAAAAGAAGGLRHSTPAPAARRSGAPSSSASAAAQGPEGNIKGAMPTRKQLLDAERADIVKAVMESGGFPAVAAGLGLTYKAR